ncbi:MAG: flavin reductase family protein [Alphaproteobacteria bacterium]
MTATPEPHPRHNPTAEAFRLAMRCFADSVCVVSTLDGEGGWHGLTASSVTSVSMRPPAVLVSINRDTRTHAAITQSGTFAANLLMVGQHSFSNTFAGVPESPDRFSEGTWAASDVTGLPILSEALAVIEAKVVAAHDFASHTLFIGEVQAAHARESGSPLIYHQGDYHGL